LHSGLLGQEAPPLGHDRVAGDELGVAVGDLVRRVKEYQEAMAE
jgi:hypothetical protein